MLIVEGPDGAGKTNLVTHLEQQLGITREPRAVNHDAVALKPMGEYITEEIGKGFGTRIYDRFALISSPFYSMLPNPTFTGELCDRDWLRETWDTFRQLGPIIIICLPPLEVVRANVLTDPDNKVVQKDIDTIYWLYHNFAAQYPFISFVWDYTQNDPADLNFLVYLFRQTNKRKKELLGLKRAGLT